MTTNVGGRIGRVLEEFRGGRHRASTQITGVERAHEYGQVQQARLGTRVNLARWALYYTSLLSKDEETYLQAAPLGEARYKSIIDAYATWAALEIVE